MDKTFSIGELAKEFSITTRSIRYYENVGLVSPVRKGSTRIYSRRDRVRLLLTLRGKRLGFSLAECGELIDLYDASSSNNNKQLQAVIDKINQKRVELAQQLADIKAILDGLDNVEALCKAALRKNNRSRKKGQSNKTHKILHAKGYVK
jgi:DNA-binding transcriptional MerR regulator